jgi:hypothetical protein
MVVFFRAFVMLLTLVGLPAAWVYYGPLPQGAQRVVDRFVEVARDAVGWRRPVTTDTVGGDMKTAPRFDDVLPTENDMPAVSRATFQGTSAPVRLASASENLPSTAASIDMGQELNSQIEPHLALLQKLGVANYSLERWGEGYRFKCAIPLGDNIDFTRQFEAINADPLATVRQVVGEVTSWQNARHEATGSATVWR